MPDRILGNLDLALVETLFDHMPDCPFFVKDQTLQYVAVNSAMVKFCGARNKKDLLGQRVSRFFSASESLRYEAMDKKVLASGKGIVDQLEISSPEKAKSVWLHFSRLPIKNTEGQVVGIVGTSREFKVPTRQRHVYIRLRAVISHIQEKFSEPLNLKTLESVAGVSKSQIERDFFRLFKLTPQQYHTQVRIDQALILLQGELSISKIAQECGYIDHSAFSRRFKASVGITPSKYRLDQAKF